MPEAVSTALGMRMDDFLRHHAQVRPQAPFLKDESRALTYAEAWGEASGLALCLRATGIKPGARIACVARNNIDTIIVLYACSIAGFVFTPLNFRLTQYELQVLLNDAAPEVIVAHTEFTEIVDASLSALGVDRHRLAFGGEVPRHWTALSGEVCAMTAQPAEIATLTQERPSSDVVLQLYTSGTTGVPKGVMLTHDNLAAQIVQQVHAYDYRYGEGDATIVAAPLFHASAFVTLLAGAFLGEFLILHEAFDVETFLKSVETDRIKHACLVPAMIQACIAHPAAKTTDFSSFEQMVYGGSAISPSVLEEAISVFSCRFTQGYGLTESTSAITALSWADHKEALEGRHELLESAGRPVVGTSVRVVDPTGNDCSIGEIGEILAKGPQIMTAGYWNKPEETASAFVDGWLRTGDAGLIDDEGRIFIKDRYKDVIISGAENIYPREVEAVLQALPYVAEVAVIGVPSDKWGEEVKAIIALKEGCAVEADAIITDCRAKLAGFKCPKSVDFIDALPRNPSGKILKFELREAYWSDFDRAVN